LVLAPPRCGFSAFEALSGIFFNAALATIWSQTTSVTNLKQLETNPTLTSRPDFSIDKTTGVGIIRGIVP
jgi:hypothetical protein